MANLLIFNKPWGVLCQFSRMSPENKTLADFIQHGGFYPAGRLDKNSEGLVLLTDDGDLQARISHPKYKLPKTYLVQLEGLISEAALDQLESGICLKSSEGKPWTTRPSKARRLDGAPLPERNPPIRKRARQQTSWIELCLMEGKNRQVRRMTAATGYPTLRLYRTTIGPWQVKGLKPGEFRMEKVHLPVYR